MTVFSEDETTTKGHARHAANQLGKAEGMVTLLRSSKFQNNSFTFVTSNYDKFWDLTPVVK